MEDTSFIDLIKEENLEKIVIDERLIPVFKQCMIDFQRYFNHMGYTKDRNYKDFFDKYLLHPYYRLLIQCNKKPNSELCDGYYSYADRKIVIKEDLLEESFSDILGVFAHEFIHFLVLDNLNNKRQFINDNYSINEAMTEMLKARIYPQLEVSYLANMEMLKFWFTMNDKELKLDTFLKNANDLEIDNIFIQLLNNYEFSLKEGDEHIYNAKRNKKYKSIQRYLMEELEFDADLTLDEYESIVSKLAKRPIEDINFVNRYYKCLEEYLCNSLNIIDENIKKRFIYFIAML